MGDRVQDAVDRARAVLDGLGAAGADGEPVEKTIWGSPAGKKRLATGTVVAGQAELVSAGVFPTGFAGGEVLDVRVMGMDQTVTFDAADQSVEQVAARMNEQLQLVSVTVDAGQLRVRTDLGGTDIRLAVLGGDANAALAFPAGEVAGAGNVAMSAEVGLGEIAAIVAADIPGVIAEEVEGALRLRTVSTGVAASIQVDPTSTLDDQLGLDNDPHLGAEGGAANALRVEGKDPAPSRTGLRSRSGRPPEARPASSTSRSSRTGCTGSSSPT